MNKLKLYLACALAGLASGVHAEWYLDGGQQSDYVDKSGDTMTGSLTLADETWIGNGASDGRVEFDNGATPIDTDQIKILGANVRIGDGTPGSAVGPEDLYVESDLEVDGNITGGTFKSVYTDFFQVWQNTPQSFATDTATLCLFDIETYDADGVHDGTTDYGRVTFNGTGLCWINFSYEINATIANDELYGIIRKNGVVYKQVSMEANGNIGGQATSASGSVCFYNDTATDYFELWVEQGESSAKNCPGTEHQNWMSGYRMPD